MNQVWGGALVSGRRGGICGEGLGLGLYNVVIVVCVDLTYNLKDLYMSIICEAQGLGSRIKRFHRLKNICGKSGTLEKNINQISSC